MYEAETICEYIRSLPSLIFLLAIFLVLDFSPLKHFVFISPKRPVVYIHLQFIKGVHWNEDN